MTEDEVALVLQGLVRGAILTVGTLCLVLGYRLFVKGAFEEGAEGKERQNKGWKGAVALDKGGPGLILALFGAIVVVMGVLRRPGQLP